MTTSGDVGWGQERVAVNEAPDSQRHFDQLPEATSGPVYGIVAFDSGLIVTWCDPCAARLFGRPAGEITGKHIDFLLPNFSRDHYRAVIGTDAHPADKGCAQPVRASGHLVDGTPFTAEVLVRRLLSPDSDFYVAVLRDVTASNAWEGRLRMLATAVAYAADCVLITNRDGVIQYVNPAFERVTGYSASEVLGKTPRLLKSGVHGDRFYRNLWNAIGSGRVFNATFVNSKKDGGILYEEKTISPIPNRAGRITHFVSTAKDVTERVLVEQRLNYVANHDDLTGLPNRNLFRQRLEEAMASAALDNRFVVLLYLDIDRFKGINDFLGHGAGDELLGVLAERLRGGVGEQDTLVRLGGDEFCVVLRDLEGPEAADPVITRIRGSLLDKFEIRGRAFTLTGSIGRSVYPTDGADIDALLRCAEIAMYEAKREGGNTWRAYNTELGEKIDHDLQLETALCDAVERGELMLYFQPQMDLRQERITALEALLRWSCPGRGFIPPSEFIPILEDTGRINEVGRWVIREACTQMRRLQLDHSIAVNVAINLSGRQFSDPGLADYVAAVLAESRLDPACVEFEITESVLMNNVGGTLDTLKAFDAMGIRVSMDDFGTGYSSLGYLRRFKIHTLKIDRSFIADITRDNDATAIVRTIVSLSHNLGIRIVAEGVETVSQCNMLKAMQCDAIQGYIVKEPLPYEAVVRYLADR